MTQSQLMKIMELHFNGCGIQRISFSENEDMYISYFDNGGNFHEQIHHSNGTFSTVN